MKAIHTCVSCLLLLASAAAVAEDNTMTIDRPGGPLIVNWGQPPPLPDQGRPDFDALDSNNDGRLTEGEAEPHALLHTDFKFADGNRNGSISKTELDRWNR